MPLFCKLPPMEVRNSKKHLIPVHCLKKTHCTQYVSVTFDLSNSIAYMYGNSVILLNKQKPCGAFI